MPSYCCSSSGIIQSHYTVLLSSFLLPFSCTSWCYCSPPCISNSEGLDFLFLCSLLFSHGSKLSAITQGFSLLTMFAKDLTGCFSHCCVEGGDHWIQVCNIIRDGERCKLPAYHSLEVFQHIGIFQLFEVKFESCVFWLAISFQMKVEGHHHQLVVTSSVYSWKTSCSGNVHSWSEALPH